MISLLESRCCILQEDSLRMWAVDHPTTVVALESLKIVIYYDLHKLVFSKTMYIYNIYTYIYILRFTTRVLNYNSKGLYIPNSLGLHGNIHKVQGLFQMGDVTFDYFRRPRLKVDPVTAAKIRDIGNV